MAAGSQDGPDAVGARDRDTTSIATFGEELSAQVHRESAGAPLAMQLLRSLQDIRGHRVLFVNDCLPVVLAMRKGSQSAQLQTDAEYMAEAGLEAGADLLYLHVPGTRMIEGKSRRSFAGGREARRGARMHSTDEAGRRRVAARARLEDLHRPLRGQQQHVDGAVRLMDGRAGERGSGRVQNQLMEPVRMSVRGAASRDMPNLPTHRAGASCVQTGKIRRSQGSLHSVNLIQGRILEGAAEPCDRSDAADRSRK